MILYHFCSKRHMRGIRCNGITDGVICGERLLNPGVFPECWQNIFYTGWQWLTLDPVRDRQSWATKKLIKYDRRDYRWTVEIPDEDHLYDRDRLSELYPGTETLFDGWPGSENWRVYRGPISKYQLKKLERWNGSGWDEVEFR